MSEVVHGVVRGGKIELIDGPELVDGQHVQVVIEPRPAFPEMPVAVPTPEEGVVHTPIEDPHFLELLDHIRRNRRPLPQPPRPGGPVRKSAAGMLADDPTWDEHLQDVLESRKAGTHHELPA